MVRRTLSTPIGPMHLCADGGCLMEVGFGPGPDAAASGPDELLDQVEAELAEYFAGQRREFSPFPLRLSGTAFQQSVWLALTGLPYGAVCTYGELAAAIGRPRSCRAVGAALGRTPIAILLPCHRVLGAGGALTGFGGGLEVKRALLALEHKNTEREHS